MSEDQKRIQIHYKNYKGEIAWRNILPGQIRFASTEHHIEEQWLMDAQDIDKGAQRSFALKDILEWKF